MLSFEIDKLKNVIQIYCDDGGLDSLISELKRLRTDENVGHIHLRAPSADGSILNDQNPWGADAVGEVIVTRG